MSTTIAATDFEYKKLGNGRPKIVCSALGDSDWLFRLLCRGVEIGHLWQPTLRVVGMPGFCPSEGYKGAFWHPDGTLHLAVLPGKKPGRDRVYHNTRPEGARAVHQCYMAAWHS